MSSTAACYLMSHQQTRQFSNKLNFISAQLIINFSPRMLWAWWHCTEGKTPSRLPPYDTQWILWCVISPAYGYFPCDFCWRILGELLGNIYGRKTCCREKKMSAFKVVHTFFLDVCANFIGMLSCNIVGILHMQCHTYSCGNENKLLLDVYNVWTPHYERRKVFSV